MPDFPYMGAVTRVAPAISNFGSDTMIANYIGISAGTPAANTWTTANTAVYCPFTISWPFLAQKMGVRVTTQSGNLDLGIYDEKGSLLVSLGSTVVAAAGLQVANITDTWLMPGTYYMAMNVDNTTAAFWAYPSATVSAAVSRPSGFQIQAVGAVALPSPATFATYTASNVPTITVTGAAL